MAGKQKRSWKKIALWVVGALVVIFAIMQAIPYGRASHTNPPATNPFTWTDPQAEAIAKIACYDCHSSETNWWWATYVAPFSWLVQADVDGGRRRFNFSDYTGRPSLEEFRHAVEDDMPPFQYTIIHGDARLSDAQKQTLIQGYADGMAAGAAPGGGSGAPPGGQGSTPTTSPATSNDAAAVVAIGQACTGCHSADVALNYHAGSAAEAQALIDNMVQQGAVVTPEQEQVLVQYFTR